MKRRRHARIEVVLGLLRDQPGLERFALDVKDPASAQYGAFLAIGEIASRFVASDDAKTAVREYFDGRAESVVFDAAGGFAVVELTFGQAADVSNIKTVFVVRLPGGFAVDCSK